MTGVQTCALPIYNDNNDFCNDYVSWPRFNIPCRHDSNKYTDNDDDDDDDDDDDVFSSQQK